MKKSYNKRYLNKVKKDIKTLLMMRSLNGKIYYKLDITDKDFDSFLEDLKAENVENVMIEGNYLYPIESNHNVYLIFHS